MNFELVHNDTDATYGTSPITKELKEAGVSCSRNRVARNPVWDVKVIALTITAAESFFSTLKRERVNRESYATSQQAKRRIEHYIRFYNHTRRHSTLEQLCHDDYEQTHIT
jgi:putative transposase